MSAAVNMREIRPENLDAHVAAVLRGECPPGGTEQGLHVHVNPFKLPVIRLGVELVPQPLWGTSIARRYPRQWAKLRRGCYRAAGYRCEICGGRGLRHPVEAHERWRYDDDGDRGVQTLDGLIALCPDCHATKHLARSRKVGGAGDRPGTSLP